MRPLNVQESHFYLFNQAGIPSWIDGCNGNSEAVGFNQTAAIWDIQWTGPQRLPGGIGAFGISAEALAINSARQVAGYVVGAIAERPLLSAALWQTSSIPNNATTTTTLLASNAAARGINDAGEVVGECYAGISTDPRACDFSAGAHTRRNFPVSTRSSAADINTAGRVTGYRDTASGTRGFHWFPATGELVDLPPITSLFTVRYRNAEALALNDAGVTVGASWDDGGQHRATIWLGDGRPVEERRWLAAPRFSLQIATSHPSHVPGRQYQPCAPNPAPLEPRHIPVRKQPSARRGNGHSDHARPRTRAETKSDAPPAVPIHHLVV